MANKNLREAKNAKNDEFYTQWADIEKEVSAYLEFDSRVFRNKTILCPCDDPEWSNFTRFFALRFRELGLKKLISTSYASESKAYKGSYKLTLFEMNAPNFDASKTKTNGKIFTLDRKSVKQNGKNRPYYDLQWSYMEGNGDFRSEEVKNLRDEADIIITNPPFSLFREFLAWIMEAQKQFMIIGNMNAITYKEVFPLIKNNKMWLGATGFNEGMYFKVPDNFVYADTYKFDRERNGEKVNRVPGVCWFSNLDHGRRHKPLPLMTTTDNLKFGKHKELLGKTTYDRYDNYDAIEVPYTDSIPSDFDGAMGVPISFLDKYCPEQFEIVGATESEGKGFSNGLWSGEIAQPVVNGERVYKRLFIKRKKEGVTK